MKGNVPSIYINCWDDHICLGVEFSPSLKRLTSNIWTRSTNDVKCMTLKCCEEQENARTTYTEIFFNANSVR